MTEAYRLVQIAEDQFESLREEWQGLLHRSSADPLFMSWDWQWSWWKHHRTPLAARLHLLSVRSADDRLIGLAPLYSHTARIRGLRLRRLEAIGQAWHNERAFYSEYFDFIVDRDTADVAIALLFQGLRRLAWDELVIPAVLPDSHVAGAIRDHLGSLRIREAGSTAAYVVSLRDGFLSYARSLPASARRHLLNHRHKLTDARFELARTAEEVRPLLERLADFKRLRWRERYADSPAIRGFEHELAQRLLTQGRLQLSALTVQGELVAVMYNARAGGVEYYIQSGFAPHRSRGLSLGYLHFGYAMEAAARDGVDRFDLLAGGGLSTDYKQALASQAVRLIVCHAVRPGWLRALYQLRDYWSRRAWRPAAIRRCNMM